MIQPRTTVQVNKILARLWIEFINNNDIEALCAITTDNWKLHGGMQSVTEDVTGLNNFFDNCRPAEHLWVIDDIATEDDTVIVKAFHYPNLESFLGTYSEDRLYAYLVTFIHRIADGRIQETWRKADDVQQRKIS